MHVTQWKYWVSFDFVSTRDRRTAFRQEFVTLGIPELSQTIAWMQFWMSEDHNIPVYGRRLGLGPGDGLGIIPRNFFSWADVYKGRKTSIVKTWKYNILISEQVEH